MKDRIVGIIAVSLIGGLIVGIFLPPAPWIPMLAIPFIAMGIALAIRASSFHKQPPLQEGEDTKKEKPREESKAKRTLLDFVTPLSTLVVLLGGLYLTNYVIAKINGPSDEAASSTIVYWRGNEEDYPGVLCKDTGIDVLPGQAVLVKGWQGIIYNKKKYPPKPLWGASRYWLPHEIRKNPGRPRREEFPFPDEKPAAVGMVLIRNKENPLAAGIRTFWPQGRSYLRIKNTSSEKRKLILVYNYPLSQSKKGNWGDGYTRFGVLVK